MGEYPENRLAAVEGSLVVVEGKLDSTVAYTQTATAVEDRVLLASASATALNNNNVLAALITDLRLAGVIA